MTWWSWKPGKLQSYKIEVLCLMLNCCTSPCMHKSLGFSERLLFGFARMREKLFNQYRRLYWHFDRKMADGQILNTDLVRYTIMLNKFDWPHEFRPQTYIVILYKADILSNLLGAVAFVTTIHKSVWVISRAEFSRNLIKWKEWILEPRKTGTLTHCIFLLKILWLNFFRLT